MAHTLYIGCWEWLGNDKYAFMYTMGKSNKNGLNWKNSVVLYYAMQKIIFQQSFVVYGYMVLIYVIFYVTLNEALCYNTC